MTAFKIYEKRKTIAKNGIERGIVVAFPHLQYRVTTHQTNAHTPYCKSAQPKMANAIFGFGLTRAPSQLLGFDRKNTIIGKVRGKAATATNKQFGKIAALTRWK